MIPSNVMSPDDKARPIGLIGIGLMGTAIGKRLLASRFSVLGFDMSAVQCQKLLADGAAIAESADAVFQSCSTIILSLPTDTIVRQVIEQSLDSIQSNALIIDTSTGAPAPAMELGAKLAEHGVEYMDATISGSSAQLSAGTAVLLVGAAEASFGRARPVLQCLSDKIFHAGSVGAGAQLKLVTNLVLGLNRAALAEGLAYAEALEIDPKLALQLLRESMSYSRIMDTKGEKMINRDYEPQAKLSQHLKDVRLMLDDSRRLSLPMPLSQTHAAILEQAVELGLGDRDNSSLIETYFQGRK